MSLTETGVATNQEILRVLLEVRERLERLNDRHDDLEREIRELRAAGTAG